MTNLQLCIAAIVLFSSLAPSSGSFASTHDDTAFFTDAADQIEGTLEMGLPLFSGTATPSMWAMNGATVESTELVDPFGGASIIDPDELNPAALIWLENEMQMSIDPSIEPQGNTTNFACLQPPYNCPANERCPLRGGGRSICVPTDCGMGACPTCPNFFANLVVTSWCGYVCFAGSKVVTSAAGFWFRGGAWKFICLGG